MGKFKEIAYDSCENGDWKYDFDPFDFVISDEEKRDEVIKENSEQLDRPEYDDPCPDPDECEYLGLF